MHAVSIYCYNNYPYSTVLIVGATIQIIGAWVRSFAIVNGEFWPILAGTSIQALSTTIFWQCQNLLINKWMPVSEYGRASALITGSYFFICVGFVLSATAFSNPNVDVKSTLNNIIFYCNIFLTVLYVFFMLTFKHQPDVPPSKIATQEPPKRNISESFAQLKTNKNFLYLLLAYSMTHAPY